MIAKRLAWIPAAVLAILPSAASGYNVYYGNFHSHCALSDGIGTPAEAFSYARDVADIDVLALTDHTHLLTPTEWSQLLSTADSFTEDGVFVALGAQEFGNLNDFGHMNIFDCLYRNPNNTDNLLGSYQFMKTQGAIGTFNHPNPSYGTNFNDLFFYPDYVDQMIGIEVRNGIRTDDYEEEYIEALQHGWRLGAFANQDNHEGHWGDQTNPNMGGQIYLTGVLADALTKADILDALRRRRVFAAEIDPPADRIGLDFYANGQIMGQEIVSGPHLSLTGSAQAWNGISLFNRVDLFQDGVIVDAATLIGTSIAWTFDRALQEGERHFYFVRVRQVDGDLAWSSPIWVTGHVEPASIAETSGETEFELAVPAPNPSRRMATIGFRLPQGTERSVAIRIHDLSGRVVGEMPAARLPAGSHTWVWKATDADGMALPAGVYFCAMVIDGEPVRTGRIVLAR